jgi:hypothetical protein
MVSFKNVESPELMEWDPRGRFEYAIDDCTAVGRNHIIEDIECAGIRINKVVAIKEFDVVGVDRKLFEEFPAQAGLGRFVRFRFSSGKFPLQPVSGCRFALAKKDVIADEKYSNRNLNHVTRYGKRDGKTTIGTCKKTGIGVTFYR